MRLPFRNELDEVFRSDKPVWLKIAGCAAVTGFVVVVSILRSRRQGSLGIDLTAQAIVALGLASAALGAGVGLALALKDVVRRRLDRGERVNPLLVLFFGYGVRSRVVWVSVLAFVIMAAIMMFW
ncbi:hypothetical protein [Paludisphaera borealis]|uniref:hypothetical protein n=1 Tax=Paludisphaera borealis TaxID=1387353 RepID=UPI000971365A|nr:hypothetical protein [Paludisphaera borealis]